MSYKKMETYYRTDHESLACDIYVEHDFKQSIYGPVASRAERAMKDIIPEVAAELEMHAISLVWDGQANYSCKDFEVPEGRTLTRYRYNIVQK